MPNPPAPNPHDSEEASNIPDQLMVFRSSEGPPPPKQGAKKSSAKLKARVCTPAPPTKDGGRKRFILSPFPEDKQLRKKIDFGDDSSSATDGPKCKGAIFPVISIHGPEGGLTHLEHEDEVVPIEKNLDMRLVCYKNPNVANISPDSGDGAGDEEAVGHEEDNLLPQPRSKLEDPTNENGVVVGDIVNLPKMDLETKMLLESPLEPCHLDESHVSLAVGEHVVPKNDHILLLAQVDSAEMLDALVAQPLLAGDLPEVANIGDTAATKLLPATDQPLLALVPNGSSLDEMANFMEIQLSPTGAGPVEGAPTTEPHSPHVPKQTLVKAVPVAAYVP